jgi:CBS domain containing-hemolysin-like protein
MVGYNIVMFIFFLILTILFLLLMLLVDAVRPVHSKFTTFELERRAGLGDRDAKKELARERLLGDVTTMQRVVVALLQVVLVLLSELTFGVVVGVLVALAIALGYGTISRMRLLKAWSSGIYEKLEPSILKFIRKTPVLFKIIGGATKSDDYYNLRIDSREELQHLVAESDSVLTSDEKKLIVHSLSFGDRLVSSIMTPKHNIVFINKSEFLGPLMLNDLHKVGHSWLPVVDGDLDHVMGILNLKGLMTLDTKKSVTAEKAMQSKVYYIRDDQTLHHALVALLHTHHHLLVVVNEARETVGILTLEDIIEALLGREIVDEFVEHDNLRAVAARKSH